MGHYFTLFSFSASTVVRQIPYTLTSHNITSYDVTGSFSCLIKNSSLILSVQRWALTDYPSFFYGTIVKVPSAHWVTDSPYFSTKCWPWSISSITFTTFSYSSFSGSSQRFQVLGFQERLWGMNLSCSLFVVLTFHSGLWAIRSGKSTPPTHPLVYGIYLLNQKLTQGTL